MSQNLSSVYFLFIVVKQTLFRTWKLLMTDTPFALLLQLARKKIPRFLVKHLQFIITVSSP